MDFDNKTILITGLVFGSFLAMYLNYQDVALAIVSGLVGYLSKDAQVIDSSSNDSEGVDEIGQDSEIA